MLDAVARLADEPALPGPSPPGTHRRRLRIGRYRVMYDITAEAVSAWHLGRGRAASSPGRLGHRPAVVVI